MLGIKYIFTLTLVFSGAYLTRVLPLSPVYFTTVIGFVFMLLFKAQDPNARFINIINAFILVYIAYLVPSQLANGADIHTFLNVLVSLFMFIMLIYLGQDMTKEDIGKSSHWFVKFSLVLLCVESCWRLTHPQWVLENGQIIAEEDISIYPFKISSIMFQDSNFVGTYTATMFFFCNYLIGISKKRIRIYKTIFAILSVLTMSRAAMIGIVFVVFVRWLSNMYKKNVALLLLFGIPLVISVLVYIITLVATDDSFMSKFFIIEQAANFFTHASFNEQLFGVGFANAKYVLGIGSHNLLVTYLVDSGIIGLLFMLGIPIIYLWANRGNGWDIVLAFFFIGMSLAGHGVPFYYAQLAVVYLLSHKMIIGNETK